MESYYTVEDHTFADYKLCRPCVEVSNVYDAREIAARWVAAGLSVRIFRHGSTVALVSPHGEN